MSKSKNSGLDLYGAELFEQQQFGTAGIEGVNKACASEAFMALRAVPAHAGLCTDGRRILHIII